MTWAPRKEELGVPPPGGSIDGWLGGNPKREIERSFGIHSTPLAHQSIPAVVKEPKRIPLFVNLRVRGQNDGFGGMAKIKDFPVD